MNENLKCVILSISIITSALIIRQELHRQNKPNWLEDRIINHLKNCSHDANRAVGSVQKLRYDLEEQGVITNNPPLTGWYYTCGDKEGGAK